MNSTIRFKITKDVDIPAGRKIIKFKGSLIAQSFTDIIHFDDNDDEYYLHYFQTSNRMEALNFIKMFLEENNMADLIVLLDI